MVYNNSMSSDYKNSDILYMEMALAQAREAYSCGEIPVGAILVRGDRVLAASRNRCEELKDPTAHAEILALREAGRILGGWRLPGTTLYVTLEPCPMCAGALVQARVERLVYGAVDPKGGACGALYNIVQDERLNHRLTVTGGVLKGACAALLQEFFRDRRA
ncbi:MAG: tRNA adenosine(34) deaminase TadA [Dethiobacteria bacterium]|jgi:tRNA(adenine34) deaminase|nr:tRNA adenosine(34) deaminase TadA [Bacillota bacterium]